MIKNLFRAILLLINLTVSGQTELQGIVKNENEEALIGANILVTHPLSHRILTYAITGKHGFYQLSVNNSSDSLMVTVSFLGYKPEKILIANHSQKLDFKLQESRQKLKEVFIKTQPVKLKGDTINYRVSALKKEEDKVLIDVIKRIPGIDVAPNGRITYQGKPINKFYIENMDMLEGRYNLASNNMPVDQIASVQVYENHQPIKLLDSLVYSENAALNIRLKKNFSYALPYELATGYRPVIWQGKFVPMLFQKKVQMLSLLQSNNAGKRLSNQLQNFYQNKTLNFETVQQTQEWTHISNMAPPPLDEDKWLDNRSHLASLNFLFKLNKKAQIKTNFSYLPEKFRENANTRQQILLQDQALTIVEHQQHTQDMKQAVWNLIFEQNSNKIYFKNNFHFKYVDRYDLSYVSNQNLIQQRYRPVYHLTDQINWMFPVKKHIYSINTFFSYRTTDENFEIKPDSFPQIFNNGQSFESLQQSLQTQKWHFDIKTGLMKKIRNWTFANYVSVQKDRHFLNSQIIPTDTLNFAVNDYSNHTGLDQTTIKNQFRINFQNNTWHLGFDLPLSYISLDIRDQTSQQTKDVNGIFQDYNFTIKHTINKWSIIGLHSKKTNFNDLYQNHFNYILKTYNQLERYNTPIQKSVKTDYKFILRFKDILNGINSSISLSYSNNLKNILYKYHYFNNGASELEAVELANQTKKKYAILNFNKYFFKSKISTKFNIMFQWTKRPLIINENLLHKTYKSIHLLSSIRIPVSQKLSFYTNFQMDNYFFTENESNIKNYHIKPAIYFYPFKQHQFHLSSDYYLMPNEKQENLFMNISYKYNPKSKKWSVFAKWNNITNLTAYTTSFGDTYYTYKSIYTLRPSNVMIGFESSF